MVLDDRQYGSEGRYLSPLGLPADVLGQDLPDVRALAETFGGQGTVITQETELEKVDWQRQGLQLLDVRIDSVLNGAGYGLSKGRAQPLSPPRTSYCPAPAAHSHSRGSMSVRSGTRPSR